MKLLLNKTLWIFSIAVSSALIVNPLYANDVVYLEKDKPSPYSGILFPVERANELRKMAIELETLRAINESYSKSIQLYQKTMQLNDEKYLLIYNQNDRLSEALVESRRSSDLQKIIWFGLGVLATGFAVYGAKKVIQ